MASLMILILKLFFFSRFTEFTDFTQTRFFRNCSCAYIYLNNIAKDAIYLSARDKGEMLVHINKEKNQKGK